MTAERRFGRVLWGVDQACGVTQVLRVVAAPNSLATGCRRLELFCTGGGGYLPASVSGAQNRVRAL